MANAATGYAPLKDKSAYVIPDFKNKQEWCASNPNSPECPKVQTTSSAPVAAQQNSTPNNTMNEITSSYTRGDTKVFRI